MELFNEKDPSRITEFCKCLPMKPIEIAMLSAKALWQCLDNGHT